MKEIYILFVFLIASTSSVKVDFSDEGYLTTSELLDKFGYTNEKHYAKTPDGYILELQRIRGRVGSPNTPDSGPTVLLMTGICVANAAFVLNGPRKSLGLTMSDEGMDVWLGNYRGSRYGQNHTSLRTNDLKFWNFDLYEMSVIDLPAIIDYIFKYVNKSKIHYVGVSFGGIGINYLLALKPEYNNKIKALYYVCSSMSFKHSKSITMKLAGNILKPISHLLPFISIPVSIFSREAITLMYDLLRNPLLFNLTFRVLETLHGPYNKEFNTSRFALYVSAESSGCPMSLTLEASQVIFFDDIQLYDSGIVGNYIKYGTQYPPVVNMSLITPPKVIFWGTNDYAVTKKDVLWTASTMRNVKKIIAMKGYNHVAALLNDDSKVKFIDPIIKQIRLLD